MLVGLCPRKEKLKRTLNTMKEVTMLKNQDRMKRQNMKFKLKKFLLVDVEEEPDKHEYKNGSVVIFGKLVKKIFKKDKITKEDVEGPFELLKGTCKNIIKLEYNMEQCHLALIYKIDWTNPESDRFHHDLSKPLPLTGPPGRKRIPVSYFFNHDLEENLYRFGNMVRLNPHNLVIERVTSGNTTTDYSHKKEIGFDTNTVVVLGALFCTLVAVLALNWDKSEDPSGSFPEVVATKCSICL
ncbi:hypothetical protein Tco_0439778 [Tanacetum coccineum]